MTNQPGSSARPGREPYRGPTSFLHAEKGEMRRTNWEFWPKASKTDAEAEKAVEKDGVRAGDKSGAACAIIVLRHLLSLLDPEDRKEVMSAENLANSGVLSGALWFRPERSVAEVERRCSPGCSFEQLMEGKQMLDTIWADPRFALSLPLFRDSDINLSRLLEIYLGARADRGLLRWDGKEGSLSAWMGSRFAENYTPDSATLKTIPGRPWVVRMRLSNTSKLRLYQDLARFKVPRYQVAEEAVEGNPQYIKRGYDYYSCVAVVKLRDRDTASDTLRLYSEKGTRLAFKFTFPWSEEWLVEDGGEYMLYFARSST
ncbi:hypothetical protein B0T24DRAFT_684075 [Lasiosphaeria ovina]|uniref:Uncharacterized protein n=1 Tax=Lasiosphaeria ovina TaxID=92902 RepID=A0AAE0JVB6_9PEZI|nr:hypothetical protein B0T24DRAFT_684075 [Lasiosphaeria ovina]